MTALVDKRQRGRAETTDLVLLSANSRPSGLSVSVGTVDSLQCSCATFAFHWKTTNKLFVEENVGSALAALTRCVADLPRLPDRRRRSPSIRWVWIDLELEIRVGALVIDVSSLHVIPRYAYAYC